jgi:DNA adenine methylase
VTIPSAPKQIGAQPRSLGFNANSVDHPLAVARYQSPLRYPGAKSGLAKSIGTLVKSATQSRQIGRVELLVEPFAGGASTALRLAGEGTVERILLADADPLVAAFWQVSASETEPLVNRLREEHLRYVKRSNGKALERWDYWRAWRPRAGMSAASARFEAAVKCLFLNRTTFSGILHGRAGPIGGRTQSSAYDIGCRFNIDTIVERVRFVGYLYDTHRLVDVWCKDWSTTLDDVPEWYPNLVPDRVLAYLDPPYLVKSEKLYQQSFDPAGGYATAPTSDLTWSDRMMHYRLAEHLRRRTRFRWILSYDAEPALVADRALYAAARMTPSRSEKVLLDVREWRISKRLVSLRYTAAARGIRGAVDELLMTTLPPETVPLNREFRRLRAAFLRCVA